jgi:hypothetical protein
MISQDQWLERQKQWEFFHRWEAEQPPDAYAPR